MMFTINKMDSSKLQAKADLLRQTIESIEEDEFDWGEFETCIIGNMAKIVLNRNLEVTDYSTPGHCASSWSEMFEGLSYRCPDTSLPVATIFQKLQDSGFSLNDMRILEFGSQSEYRSWGEFGHAHTESKESVLERLKIMLQNIEQEISRQPV